MRSVLVPLDGTDLSAAILPDARRLAGKGGELILIRDVASSPPVQPISLYDQQGATDGSGNYLDIVAQVLRAEGVRVRTQQFTTDDPALAIDEGAQLLHPDVIACATHGRSPEERWRRGSVAWRALLRSAVPLLLRHVDPEHPFTHRPEPISGRLMVPLDGSVLAERALPLAQELAQDWSAPIWLVRVVPEPQPADIDIRAHEEADEVHDYLDRIARTVSGEVHWRAFSGPVVETLVRAVAELEVTDLVMTSHGRTAVSRAIVGSVVDALIHDLRCPIVVIPLLAAMIEPVGS